MIDKINTVICGSAREKLKELPAGSVNCIITSPPYWALRDYGIEPMIWDGDTNCEHKWGQPIIRKQSGGTEKTDVGNYKDDRIHYVSKTSFCSLCGAWRGCLGLEPTIELYLKHLVGIFEEAKRVLRDDGTCFVNLGDTYAGHKGNMYSEGLCGEKYQELHHKTNKQKILLPKGVPAKSLCLIPFRFAIEMVNHGWILRNTIIWSKPNPMPSSAKDRFTVDFEYVFFFSKKKKYWFEPQYEAQSETSHPRYAAGLDKPPPAKPDSKELARPGYENWRETTPIHKLPLGRNKRTTWTIPTEPFPEAHFATFPCALVEPMIRAGCPEFVCPKCGKARVKVYETKDIKRPRLNPTTEPCAERGQSPNDYGGKEVTGCHYTSCSCNAGYEPGVVADFFSGSGTVGKVAAYLRRNYILIDAKKEYCQMAKERIAEPESGVPVAEQRQGQQSLFEREGQ